MTARNCPSSVANEQNCEKGSFIYFDTLFASKQLFNKLLEPGLNFVCAVRGLRFSDCPMTARKNFENSKRGTYELFYHVLDMFEVIGWRYKKRVLLAGNVVGVEPLGSREQLENDKEPVSVPRDRNQPIHGRCRSHQHARRYAFLFFSVE